MNIFMTGATGYVGGGVARELAAAGHRITGLARNAESAADLRTAGHQAVVADLRRPDAWLEHVRQADATIHAANTGDEDAGAVDSAVTRAILDALAGSGKAFLYTSGVWVLGDTAGREVDESFQPREPAEKSAWRLELEAEIRAAAGRGLRPVVIRPGIVFGEGGGIPGMIADGQLPLVEGGQHWPLVHVEDLGRFYRLALESAPAGAVLHAVALTLTADEVHRRLTGREPEPVPQAEARKTLGAFGDALALDQHVSAARSARLLGWRPQHEQMTA